MIEIIDNIKETGTETHSRPLTSQTDYFDKPATAAAGAGENRGCSTVARDREDVTVYFDRKGVVHPRKQMCDKP